MPIIDGKYVNPGWVNGGPPAINADELNAISEAIVSLETQDNNFKAALNAIGLDIENGAFVISPVMD